MSDKELQNVGFVLNGVGDGYKSKYGYSYGYKYSYAYNYGYGTDTAKKKIINLNCKHTICLHSVFKFCYFFEFKLFTKNF